MNDFLANFYFNQPFWLWLLLGLPLLWIGIGARPLLITLWRAGILLVAVVILAEPQTVIRESRTHDETRLFAFDLSRSIPESMRRWMIDEAIARLAPGPHDRIFVFGSEAREVENWQDWLRGTVRDGDSIRPGKTSLTKLFDGLLGLPPGARDLFLFTDGWENEGEVERLLPTIASSGLRVFPVVPPAGPRVPNIAVAKLLAPSHAETGEAVGLRVVLENHGEAEIQGTLALSRNGETLKTESVRLPPGSHIFSHQTTLTEGALTAFRASFTPGRGVIDSLPSDNQALAWVTVRSKAKVLLLNGRPGGGRYLEELLKRRGFEVTSRTGDSAPPPSGYQIVIFNNIEREKLSAGYLAGVERHVASGGAFVMLGSEWSFGPGGYRRTPIETILPVEFKEPRKEEKNRAVVLVIDKSGSMREDNRLLFAQEAAKAVARQLKDDDLLAVVGFDVSPFTVVPMETVGLLRGRFDRQVDRLKPGGQTYFFPALVEAKRQLEKQNVARKHIILLSDGETRGSQGELIDLVNVMRTEMRITVSAIAIGSEADVRVMKRISQYGGGLFHHTIDPASLPRIVLQQLQETPPDDAPQEKDWPALPERGSEILAGFSANYPPVRGLIDTELKRGAQLDLATMRDGQKVPLMASWKYGQGKTIALMLDLEGRWSKHWIQWGGLTGFWGRILDWLQPAVEAIPSHEARINILANRPVLDLYVYEDASAESQFRFTLTGRAGKSEHGLKRLAAGHHQAVLPVTAPGDYRIDLVEERRGRRIAYPPLGYTLPYDLTSENPRPDLNLGLLSQLAQVSGGVVNPASIDPGVKTEISRHSHSYRRTLIPLLFVLFLIEIALRRLVFGEN